MDLFEFLMILLSIIVGLGLAEILIGYARLLRTNMSSKGSWLHGAVGAVVFLAMLQSFWESWGLRDIDTWSYPAMLLMLTGPILLFVIAHVLFPEAGNDDDFESHYFSHSRQIWLAGIVTAIASVLFRPIAFGMPLFVVDNASVVALLLIFAILMSTKRTVVHQVLVPMVLVAVILDTLVISYLIS